jgi:outer membrane protein assembly factor BamB
MSGESAWQTKIGLQGSPVSVSNSLFFISDRNELVRLNKNTGKIIWSRKVEGNENPIHYFTPILAGSKLWLTGSDTFLRSFNVNSGRLIDKVNIKTESVGPPIYYSRSIIVYTKTSELMAFE